MVSEYCIRKTLDEIDEASYTNPFQKLAERKQKRLHAEKIYSSGKEDPGLPPAVSQ